jgi:hypothetical protein
MSCGFLQVNEIDLGGVMKRSAVVILIVLALCLALAQVAAAKSMKKPAALADVQVVEVLIGKILEDYMVLTTYGNVYFNERDTHKLVNAAAHLRPIDLGFFTTDTGQTVKVIAKKFDRGMVTLVISH